MKQEADSDQQPSASKPGGQKASNAARTKKDEKGGAVTINNDPAPSESKQIIGTLVTSSGSELNITKPISAVTFDIGSVLQTSAISQPGIPVATSEKPKEKPPQQQLAPQPVEQMPNESDKESIYFKEFVEQYIDVSNKHACTSTSIEKIHAETGE